MVSSEFYIADNSDMENKKLEAAKNHYTLGDYNAALKLYLSLINTSTSYMLYHRIAKCYYKLNSIESAEENFKKSTNLEPHENPSFLYLGNIHYKKGDLKNAIYYWLRYYSYKPENETVCLNLATSYFSRGMKFQSIFYYEKYLKYAQNKGNAYAAIKTSIDEYSKIGEEFLQKARYAVSRKDNKAAIEFLTFAEKNMPANFDINYLLGSAYLEENDNMHALIYLKQALCLDSKSLDILQKLISVYINLGDYTGAYCMMRRLLPLVIHNQAEYLKTLKAIKELGSSFDDMSYTGHLEWGDKYYDDNNYHFALLEYENCVIVNEKMQEKLSSKIEELKLFINPEPNLIQSCIAKGSKSYHKGDFKEANKYFTKVMQLSDENSSEYKLAKSRVANAK